MKAEDAVTLVVVVWSIILVAFGTLTLAVATDNDGCHDFKYPFGRSHKSQVYDGWVCSADAVPLYRLGDIKKQRAVNAERDRKVRALEKKFMDGKISADELVGQETALGR